MHLPATIFGTHARCRVLPMGSYSSDLGLLREAKTPDATSFNLEIHANYRCKVGDKTVVENIFRTALGPATHRCIFRRHRIKNDAMRCYFLQPCRVETVDSCTSHRMWSLWVRLKSKKNFENLIIRSFRRRTRRHRVRQCITKSWCIKNNLVSKACKSGVCSSLQTDL